MGKLTPTTAWFIADANVLIDYAQTSPDILGLVARHIGPVYVAAAVLDEVEQLDEAQCQAIGLTSVEGSLAQMTEAVCRSLDARPEQVRIILSEMPREGYAIAGKLTCDKS